MKYLFLPMALLMTTCLHAAPLTISLDCAEWQKARQENNYHNALSWLQGYVTAYNQYEYTGRDPEGVLGTRDSEAVAQWMDNYCKQHKASTPKEAIESLVEERQHVKKACPVRRQSGRPCIPAEEAEKPDINE